MAVGMDSLKQKCRGTLDHLKSELGKMRSGRASAGMLESIHVDYYGSSVPLRQIGMINAPEPRLITIQVFDTSAVEAAERALKESDLGLNPSREGNLLRVPISALTDDRRKELIKRLHKVGEDTKIAIRGHRRDVLDSLKKAEKAKGMSEDDLRRGQDEIQKAIDQACKDVDSLVEAKESEMKEM